MHYFKILLEIMCLSIGSHKLTHSTEKPKTKVCVVHPHIFTERHANRHLDALLEEALNLTAALPDLDVVHSRLVTLKQMRPATLLGAGVVEELKEVIKAEKIGLAIVNGSLTPIQQRNLEKAWNCKVIDRTGLILEIFGERASTKEGELQVELAALTYQRSRLVRTWTHLERQRGGHGFTGGPGEKQLEIDRRLIDVRILRLKKDLEKIKKTRSLHRKARKKVPYPIVALVGYTNAGKSTLFNRLTGADVLAEDMLFATLDPTMRALKLPSGVQVVLSDTVGFISDLPTSLVAAFRATLEEVLEADIIVHVRDISHEDTNAQAQDVRDVLKELGVDYDSAKHVIEVWNKMDLLDPEGAESLQERAARQEKAALCASALTGTGERLFLQLVEEKLLRDFCEVQACLELWDAKSLAWFHENTTIIKKNTTDEFVQIQALVRPAQVKSMHSFPLKSLEINK